jgi:hypothetical protein
MRKLALSDTSTCFVVPATNEIRLNVYELQLAVSFRTSLRHISKCQQRLQIEESPERGCVYP